MTIPNQSTIESRETPTQIVVESQQTDEGRQLRIPEIPERLIDETPSGVGKEEELVRLEDANPDVKQSDAGQKPSSSKRKQVSRIISILVLLALVGAGFWQRERLLKFFSAPDGSRSSSSNTERKVLYWQDPMHPAYTSDKPGKAPDCGMDLVPVYDDGMAEANLPEGAFRISSEKQQMIQGFVVPFAIFLKCATGVALNRHSAPTCLPTSVSWNG